MFSSLVLSFSIILVCLFVCFGTDVEIPIFRKITNIILNNEQAFILTCRVETLYFYDHLMSERVDSFSVLPFKELICDRPYNKQYL